MTKSIYSCLSKEPGSELIDVALVLADNPKKAREIAQEASVHMNILAANEIKTVRIVPPHADGLDAVDQHAVAAAGNDGKGRRIADDAALKAHIITVPELHAAPENPLHSQLLNEFFCIHAR